MKDAKDINVNVQTVEKSEIFIPESTKEWLKKVAINSQSMRLDKSIDRFKANPSASAYVELERAMLAYQKSMHLRDEELLEINSTSVGKINNLIDGYVDKNRR